MIMIRGADTNHKSKVYNKGMLFGRRCPQRENQWMMIWRWIIKSVIFGEFSVFQELHEFFNYDHDPRCKNTNKK